MKPKSTLRSFLSITGSTLLAISYSHAATLYWDGNSTDGNANGGAGTWIDGATTNWDTLAFGGADSVWTNGADTAVFGGTAGTATIGAGGVTVGGLTFNTTAYTVAAGTNGLTFSSGTNKVWLSAGLNGSPNAIISGTVAGTSADLNFVANPGAATTTLTFSATSAGGWTGSTTIGPSKIVISDSTGGVNRVFNNTSAININGSALMFRRSGNSNTNLVSDSAAITVNGGGSLVQANLDSGGASAIETVGAVTVNFGQFNFLNTNGGSSGSRIDFNGLTVGATAAVTFNANAASNNFWRNLNGGSAPANTPAGEILGAWATFGGAPGGIAFTTATQTDYAVYTGANGTIAASGITASAESTWSTAHAATSNYTLTNALASGSTNGRLTATRNINSLRNTSGVTNLTSVDATLNTITVTGSAYTDGDVVTFGGTAPGGLANNVVYYVTGASGTTFSVAATSGGAVIDLTSAGTANVAGGITLSTGNNLGTYGILNGSTALLAIGRSGTGVVTLPSAASDNLYVTAGSSGIAINAPITNNGAGVLTLIKNGSSALFLTGANTYTGGTVINAGNITVSAAAGWVASQNLTFGGTGSLAASVGALTGGTLTANQGATGTITGTSGITFTSTSGAGQIIYGGGSSATLNLGNASGFTGNAVLAIGIGGSNPRPTLRFSSMADTAGSYIGWGAGGSTDSNQRAQIELNDNGGALTFDNRQLVNLPRTGSNNSAKSLILGNNNSTAANKWVINTDFLNQADRGGQGLIFEGSNTGDNAFNGVIGNSTLNGAAMNVYKTGTGKWILDGNNTFTGRLIAGQGTLSVDTLNEVGVAGPLGMNNNIQLGGDERTGVGGNATEVRLVGSNSGTLVYTGGNVTSSRSFFIGDSLATNTGGGTIANNGTGAITFSAATFNPAQAGITASRTLFLGGSYTATANEVQGTIQDNVSATGKVVVTVFAGDWKLSGNNTHDGLTTVNSSATMTLSGDNSGAGGGVTLSTSGTGANTPRLNLNSATALGSGTLNFGGGAATDTIRLDNTSAGLVTVSTSNVFTLNRNFTFIGTQSLDLGNMTTTLGGLSAGTNRSITVTANTLTLGGSIGEAAANLGISKAGAGTLVLAANSSYTGATAVAAGTLALGAANVLPDATPVTIGNATLDAVTFDDSVGTLTVTNAASTINLGSGANLSFATGSPAWTGTLNLTGTLNFSGGPSSSLRFGTTTAGLTPTQLAAISAPGWSAFALDVDGYLTATAGGNTPPTISDIANQSIPSGGNTGALAFTVGDAETAVGSLNVTVSSSNLTLVPNANIVPGGSGASRNVTVTPVSGLVGSATITVTVTDGGLLTAQDTFTLTVTDNYLSWATLNGVTGGTNGDHDNDGVRNLVEYALIDGGERGVLSSNTITFTKRGVPYGSDLTYIIETSETLVGAWTDVVTHGPGLLITNPTISYTFTPGTPVKKFARLEVLSAP